MRYPSQPKPYAETHFVIRPLPLSRYHRRCPEIIADAPRRVEPGHNIPILIIVKDAHRYPITLQSVTVQWYHLAQSPVEFPINQYIDTPFWSRILTIPTDSLPKKLLTFDVVIRATRNRKDLTIRNNNYVGLPHTPISVFLSEYPFPKLPGWAVGDLHVHTNYTSDQVEFGAPVADTALIAQTQGHDFFAATDHSYNLDDTWGNPLKNDPNFPKYKALMDEIDRWNRENGNDFPVLPGEEVSAGNHRNRNVHLLVLGPGQFIPGKGDSAEVWLPQRPDLTVNQITASLDNNRVALAAHPEDIFPTSHKLFLRRGDWEQGDFQTANLSGIQLIRGDNSTPFQKGIALWVKLLLQGLKMTLTAGSDAHGDFNRYLLMGTPMISLKQRPRPVFGEVLTLIPKSDLFGASSIISHIRQGKTGITTGPAITLDFLANDGNSYSPGQTCPQNHGTAVLQALSSPEFGPITNAMLWTGNQTLQAEELLWSCHNGQENMHLEQQIQVTKDRNWKYLRAEIQTEGEMGVGRALTGAIYFQ